jgi:DNA-binding response OmpR family regulator
MAKPRVKPVSKSTEGTETVLLVEDDVTILSLGKKILERHGYTVLAASTPVMALAMAADFHGPIRLIVTDVVMPEMNGRELVEKLKLLFPDVKVLFMSGYTANVIAHHGIMEEDIAFLPKPFSATSLTEKVRVLLDE